MNKSQNKFKLIPQFWYAWEMIPGYVEEGNVPYCSPIFIQRVVQKKTGKGILALDFLNVFYAEGVQDFSLELRVLKRSADYLVADLLYGTEGPDRSAIISHIGFPWIERFCPELWRNHLPSSVGRGAEESVSVYLNMIFGLRQRAE